VGEDKPEITAMLEQSRSDEHAREQLYQLIYADLRRLAGRQIASARPGATLSVTSLVNEAYLKLTERTEMQWNDRGHFFRVAATAMRQITIDYVRAKLSQKRGAGKPAVSLDTVHLAATEKPEMVLALEEGLRELGGREPRLVEVVECRFFAGLTVAETAIALEVSERTVEREWQRAKQWLKDYLS
jgi:RNA polymerase sigma factor (TIGR02999 family)